MRVQAGITLGPPEAKARPQSSLGTQCQFRPLQGGKHLTQPL